MAIVHQRGWAAEALHESPWYFPWERSWQHFAEAPSFPTPEQLSTLYQLRTGGTDLPVDAARLRFVGAPAKKRKRKGPVQLSSLYEGQIVERGAVPTRACDWHDFFNALTFVAFPRAKWALHARQYRLLAARIDAHTRRLPGARTREQDALALFDEGGIALLVDENERVADDPDTFEASALALCERGAALPVPFGHALPEHLVEGLECPLGTVHVVYSKFVGARRDTLLDALDQALARDLADPSRFTMPSPARGLSLPALAQVGALDVWRAMPR